MNSGTPIHTIGYGAREIDSFLKVLQANHIRFLIDVRSKPYSGYKPEYSKHALQTFLETHGIRYIFLGDNLGGQPDDERCYTDGKVDYDKVEKRPFYQAGIERLHKASQQGQRVVLMCSEGKPENCHRSKLIGQTLTRMGIDVKHIDENDEIITQNNVLLRLSDGQPSLFGDDFFTYTSRKKYRDAESNEEKMRQPQISQNE